MPSENTTIENLYNVNYKIQSQMLDNLSEKTQVNLLIFTQSGDLQNLVRISKCGWFFDSH
jgi:hypothetical protein